MKRTVLASLVLVSCISKPDRPLPDSSGGSTRHWVKRTNASQPGALSSPRLAFDPNLKTVVLWSGSKADKSSEVAMWALGSASDPQGVGWTVVCKQGTSTPCGIPERFRGGFAANDMATFNFAGAAWPDGQYAQYNDAYEFSSGGMWNKVVISTTTAAAPTPRDLEQMVWDPDFKVFLAYGGLITGAGTNHLFAFDLQASSIGSLNGSDDGSARINEGR